MNDDYDYHEHENCHGYDSFKETNVPVKHSRYFAAISVLRSFVFLSPRVLGQIGLVLLEILHVELERQP